MTHSTRMRLATRRLLASAALPAFLLASLPFPSDHAAAQARIELAQAAGGQPNDEDPRRKPPQQQQRPAQPPAAQQPRPAQQPQQRVQPPPQPHAPPPVQRQAPAQVQPPTPPAARPVQQAPKPVPPPAPVQQAPKPVPPPVQQRVQPPPPPVQRQTPPPAATQTPAPSPAKPPAAATPPAPQPQTAPAPVQRAPAQINPSQVAPSTAPVLPPPAGGAATPVQRTAPGAVVPGATPPAGGTTIAPPAAGAPPAGGAAIRPVDRRPATALPLPPPPTTTATPLRADQPPPAGRRLDDFRGQRREVQQGGRTIITEPGRVIVRDGTQVIIRHNEVDRFRIGAQDVRVQQRGATTRTVIMRPGGIQIINVTDSSGRLLQRIRRDPSGREIIIIDNTFRPRNSIGGYFVAIAPPLVRIPRERYIVEAEDASEDMIYETLIAPPVERLERRYTLDEIRYSEPLRQRMRRVDVDTVTFETGSWEVTPDQAPRLQGIARAILRAIERNPREVFLIEGHTDAVGADVDNLSLSDRRAQAVAEILSSQFGVPAENLTTQGYGEQYLKVQTDGPERQNRRVTMRRITPLLTGQGPAGNGAQPQ